MASLDGIMIAAINSDLNKELIDGRIDKIYQVDKHLMTVLIRNNNYNYKLLISSHPQYSRVHITEQKFNNPVKAPDFCMLLRKYLLRGTIVKIEQPDFERILNFEILIHNKRYNLFVEIMGKYSNIILVNPEGIVLDAIKRVTDRISSERQLYPGIKYKYPPKQDKLNPLLVNQSKYIEKIEENFPHAAYKAIMYNFRGIGPYSAKEIVYRAGIDPSIKYNELNRDEKDYLFKSFDKIMTKIDNNDFLPTAGIIHTTGDVIHTTADIEEKSMSIKEIDIDYLSPFPLTHLDVEQKEFKSTGKLLDYYYQIEIIEKQLKGSKRQLHVIAEKYLSKNLKKQKKFNEQLEIGKNAEKYKKIGELITANIYQINKGLSEIEVVDYYDTEQNMINIKLDPRLLPSENAQKYFKKYTKAKKSVKHLKKQLGIFRHEERYLEQVILNIEQAESKEELNEIREELVSEGYIEEKKKKKTQKNKKPLPPQKFRSTEGYDILVGRNNQQNDYLTKKLANSQDIWLHVKDLAGSHVIIRNHTRDEIPEQTIEEAAVLAAYYSKGRMSENVPIDYTEVKNVKKPAGAKPGLVYYESYQTIYATPDDVIVQRLKQKG
ncbi:MAG: Rqc2 family fibronectin-binding protein [bacterium]